MRDFTWSHGEKKVAKRVFEAALEREMSALRGQVEGLLAADSKSEVVWEAHNLLSRRRREIDQKYDYRYSVLIQVLARLVSEDLIDTSELAGLNEEKIGAIETLASFMKGERP